MPRFLFFIFLLLSATARCAAGASPYSVLDPYIFGDSLKIVRSGNKASHLKAMRNSLPPSRDRLEITTRLGDYYQEHQVDSSFMYWNIARAEARSLGLDREEMRLRMKIDRNLPFVDLGSDGFADFSHIKDEILDDEMKHLYYLGASEFYFNLGMRYPHSQFRPEIYRRTVENIDSLLPLYKADDPIYRYLYAFRNYLDGNEAIGAAVLSEVLPEIEDRPSLYARACMALAAFYQGKPNRNTEYKDYLTLAALSGLRQGVVRPQVLADLGVALFNDGDTRRGRRLVYMALSAEDADNSLYRIGDTSAYVAILASVDRRDKLIRNIIPAMMILLAAVMIIVIVVLWRRAKLASIMLDSLREAKDKRIAELRADCRNYLQLAFSAVENLKEFSRYAQRKLTAGQAKDLFKSLENNSFVNSQAERFFEEFDTAFLESSPQFVERLNALLRPDARLEMAPNNRLTAELRIAALMSMGMVDSARMATVLGLSLNTVYTYRNRLKSRAVNRDEFEKKLTDLSR